jgi:chemotaxis protein histidine kinase CheA
VSADPALVAEFANEVSEHLDASEQILVAASVEAPSPDDINLLFRSFHSIKGLARVIAFGPLEGIAHEAESLLATVRSGAQPLTEGATNLLLQSLDVIKQARTELVEGRTFAGNDKLIAALKAATKGGGGGGPVAESAPQTARRPARPSSTPTCTSTRTPLLPRPSFLTNSCPASPTRCSPPKASPRSNSRRTSTSCSSP